MSRGNQTGTGTSPLLQAEVELAEALQDILLTELLRTLRMMRNYGEGDRHSARRHRAPQDSNTISVAEVREKMIDHVYEIVELNEKENREQHSQHIFNDQV